MRPRTAVGRTAPGKKDGDSIKKIPNVGNVTGARRGIDVILQREPSPSSKLIGRISSSDLITVTIIDTWTRARPYTFAGLHLKWRSRDPASLAKRLQ